jgi:hypothetical protein
MASLAQLVVHFLTDRACHEIIVSFLAIHCQSPERWGDRATLVLMSIGTPLNHHIKAASILEAAFDQMASNACCMVCMLAFQHRGPFIFWMTTGNSPCIGRSSCSSSFKENGHLTRTSQV